MGQSQSSTEKPLRTGLSEKERKINRRISVPTLSQTRSSPSDPLTTREIAQGTTQHNDRNVHEILSQSSTQVKRSKSTKATTTSPPSGNINIPAIERKEELEFSDHKYAPISHHRPPRLPLPIAEVPTTPDSPTLLPLDKGVSDIPIFETDDTLIPIQRKTSILSTTTQDEEDVGEELQPYGVGFTGQTVPTLIRWNHPAEKVFVTGTFAAWDKKYRLKSDENGKFHTTINLPPGTHHLKFFVDNQMITSDDLPTAVDFNNILVNYIEISTDDIPKQQRRESSQQQPTAQEDYSGTVTPGNDDEEIELPIEEMPEGDFRQLIPQSLLDIDLSEDDPRYKQATQVIQDSPAPPSLPLFLSRSILNGNLPVKDDSSVLALPNHTVLNHLMTSSVRNGVLSTSVTTRYKKKYVTTISFKPVPRTAVA